ncbi:MAG TPA: dockerin type I domain-containing protein [Phycisphaerae bacterium]|nr:dockerin type I domain-containing protein [Phycisphaerae bacterium]HRW52457.1 dockerin type I domain-containing protein [Phycisphaerae bacterium]
MARNALVFVLLITAADASGQPIDPWVHSGTVCADGVTLNMHELRKTLTEQAALIRSVAELTGVSGESRTSRGGGTGLARLVECNGLFGYDNIQAAIDESEDGDVVVVFPNTCNPEGRWFENLYLYNKKIRLQSTNPSDASLVETTVIDGTAPPEQPERSVISCYSIKGDTVIQGLTLTNGTGVHLNNTRGGGLYCYNASPSIWDCRIINNRARRGGGVFHLGGGTFTDGAGEIRNCLFRDNVATTYGGAIYSESTTSSGASGILITDCRVENNNAGSGGAIYLYAGGDNVTNTPVISSCRFAGNSAGESVVLVHGIGGNASALATFRSCAFEGNKFWHSLIFAESSQNESSSIVNLESCTVVNNVSTFAYLIAARTVSSSNYSDVKIRNSIVWSNSILSNRTEAATFGSGARIHIDYSNFEREGIVPFGNEDIIWGEGNFSITPGFVDPGGIDDGGTPNDLADDVYIPGDYHLLPSSPCIDAGAPDYETFEGDLDIDSDARVMNCRIDVGADEFNPAVNPIGDYDGDGQVDSDDLSSFITALLNPQECNLGRGDTNEDGAVNSLDVQGFVEALLADG